MIPLSTQIHPMSRKWAIVGSHQVDKRSLKHLLKEIQDPEQVERGEGTDVRMPEVGARAKLLQTREVNLQRPSKTKTKHNI